ncbi:MAG TPA: PD-(D/E)XK nuclease family protein, partial [Gemmatimonas sp.]|uniref:PD-(D/E)XK nuclease family protein n=1 Tax=Gemmatimonas sp. TaxID=1962908 RepID=UPI002ED79A79
GAPVPLLMPDASDFRTFPAGAEPGTVLHAILEHAPFDGAEEQLRPLVQEHLSRLPLKDGEFEARAQATRSMMQRLLRAPIATFGFALHEVPTHHTLREWQFLLPLASANHAMTRQALADVFARHGGAHGERYAEQILRLGVTRVHGYLTGFVDLLFEHHGRWYVVDWKSNQLGFEPGAYDTLALQEVMDGHHYTLQYHLYLVAAHRYLRQRVPGYTYDTHIGGAAYAFLRGFAGDAADTSGWYVDRPAAALIHALSDVLDGVSPAAGGRA